MSPSRRIFQTKQSNGLGFIFKILCFAIESTLLVISREFRYRRKLSITFAAIIFNRQMNLQN